MPSTPNLGLTHIETAQAQKEVTANANFDGLDTAANDTVDVATGAGGTITVTLADFTANENLRLTGAPAAAFTLALPGTKRAFSVNNQSGKSATVTTSVSGGAQTIIIGPGEKARLYSNGVDVVLLGSSAVIVPFFIAGEPTSNEVSCQIIAPIAFTIPAGAVLSLAKARSGTGSWEESVIFDIQRNASSIGTVTFSAASVSGTLSIGSAVDVAVGDLLAIVNPTLGSPTTELRNVSITIWGAA